MSNHDEAKWALFVCKKSEDSETSRRQEYGRDKLGEAFRTLSQQSGAVHILGPSVAWLPLPDRLPHLAQFVACAQEYGLQYTVQLFGQPILSYSSELPQEIPAKTEAAKA